MRIGVLGTGMVGRTIGSRLVELGHEVKLGSRSADNEAAASWAAEHGEPATAGSFADAASHGELLFNCTAGAGSLEALAATAEDDLAGKLLIDVANPLDHSVNGLPTLTVANTDSLGERIQATFPRVRVVKSLNTVNCEVMVDPSSVPGEHVIFVCGNEEEAKREAVALLGDFGWPGERVIDLGGISASRGTEMYLALWLRLMGAVGTNRFNIALAR